MNRLTSGIEMSLFRSRLRNPALSENLLILTARRVLRQMGSTTDGIAYLDRIQNTQAIPTFQKRGTCGSFGIRVLRCTLFSAELYFAGETLPSLRPQLFDLAD